MIPSLAFWPLLVDEELPRNVRDALTIAALSASPRVAAVARRRAACGLMAAYGLTAEEAAELTSVDAAELPCVRAQAPAHGEIL